MASEALAARYPLGSTATVAHDPVEPQRSVPEPDGGIGLIWLLAAGVVLLGFGMVLLIGANSRCRRPRCTFRRVFQTLEHLPLATID